jgi:hypothetical protein
MLCGLAMIRALLLTLFCTWSSAVYATSAVEVTFTDLVTQADVIAVGTVTEIREQWDTEKKTPLTLVTFSNLTTVKGSPGSSFTLEFLGGKMPNGLVMVVAGVPQFTVGERAVVFSAGNHRDFCPLVGIWQGLLRVATDPQQGVETVSDSLRVPIMKIQEGRFVKRSPETTSQSPLPLSTLLQAIRNTLQPPNH